MKKTLLGFLSFIITICNLYGQYDVLKNTDVEVLKSLSIIMDKNYSIEQVANDSSLQFSNKTLIENYETNKVYWVKCIVQNNTLQSLDYYASIYPILNNTLYYFNNVTKKWESKTCGLGNDNGMRNYLLAPITFIGNNITTFYIKMDVRKLGPSKNSLTISVNLYSKNKIDEKERSIYLQWVITLAIVFLLLLYNLYAYLINKEKFILYYLLIVIGGIIYITGISKFFYTLTSFRFYKVVLKENERIYSYDLDIFLSQIGIILVITGFVEFSRNYLQTKKTFPIWDKVVKYLLWLMNSVIILLIITTSTDIWYSSIMLSPIINILVTIIILNLLFIGIVATKRKYDFGKYFLIANVLPLVFMLALAVYLVVFPTYNLSKLFIPNLAILSLVVTFAFAIAAKISTLKKRLLFQEEAAAKLKDNVKTLQDDNAEKDVFLKEIHHRVKNNLQIISSLLYMQFKDSKNDKIDEQIKLAQERIKTMALVHNKLYQNKNSAHLYINEYIKDLANNVLESNVPSNKEITLNIKENANIMLSLDTTISLGLILNELITNSCKYAFTNKDRGNIEIHLTKEQNGYQLVVKDDGSGIVDNYTEKKSLGVSLVNNLAKQLGGKASFANKNGTEVIIQFTDIKAA